MENVDGQGGTSPLNEGSKDNIIDLRKTLDNWVNERPFFLSNQRSVRQDVANAISTDILDPIGKPDISPRVISYRGFVDQAASALVVKIDDLPKDENGVIKKSESEDKVTGVKFTTQIRRVDDAWISEEIKEDGEIISRAKIGDNGSLDLTLNFSGQRYESKSANPKLKDATAYPTGTKVLFLKHAASLGIISWKGKFTL